MKKNLKVLLTSTMALTGILSMTACGNNTQSALKIGVILVGDETEGYTEAHINGIESAAKKLGLEKSQIVYEKKIEENDACSSAAKSLVSEGCKLIISNSYGHQDYMAQVASEHSDVTFVANTGDYAAISGLKNFKNAFTSVYESRYVSGVIAGMKLKELVDSNKLSEENKDTDGNWKIGYVGAFNYAEVVSGYTAFFLGIQSIVSNISMEVKYTDSWFSIEAESAAAEYLINNGCVIIGQHADSTGAPSKCQSKLSSGKVCYSVGYNIDMLSVAKDAALTSATNNWEVYYEYAFSQAMNNKEIVTDWAKGYNDGAVGITALGESCATGTAEKVAEVEAAIKNGTLHIFDTSKFTVNGEHITSNKVDMSYRDWAQGGKVIYQGETVETVKTDEHGSYVSESEFRSAPYFSLRIDGIKETSADNK